MKQKYRIAVIGGGHGGIEAALASARMGVPTVLITQNIDKIGEMSCNPSIGGVGKGQLVKELDALGGEMGKAADETGIQFKRLNTRKGSAVQSSRCQSDKVLYAKRMQRAVSFQENLEVLEGEVISLRHNNSGEVCGLEVRRKNSAEQESLDLSAVVLTTGTFLRAVMHCGPEISSGGRYGEPSANFLSDSLKAMGLSLVRLKTGTPPRLRRGSIDFSQMDRQVGDFPPRKFSLWDSRIELPQQPCFLTYTSAKTHEVIRENLGSSPLFSGQIIGVGPRYCPSIEDKIVKFPQRDRHPLFFEPESLSTDWIYPNGVSTSLPPEVQEAALKTLPGCQNVEILRFGYAVEYDCVDPKQLSKTFETKKIPGLFLAGQINGTSGYEEAAIQGLLAGINAALRVQEREPFILGREEAYAGVLIDDLVRHGVSEPYRMFTSRAEYRLSLREDNADARLVGHGHRLGLISDSQYQIFEDNQKKRRGLKKQLSKHVIPASQGLNQYLTESGTPPLTTAQLFLPLLKRPEVSLAELKPYLPGEFFAETTPELEETVEIEIKYEGYISRQSDEIAKLKKMQALEIPRALDFQKVEGLSTEVRSKLAERMPKNLSEAAQIPGVTPAALTSLLFHIQQKNGKSHAPLA